MNKRLLNRDTTLKILSVMFAILLWFYVITEQNPEITKDITIPVKLINQEYLAKNNMVLVKEPAGYSITLRVKGRKNTLDRLTDGTVSAFADLEGHKNNGENIVKINLDGIPEGVNLLWMSSESLKIFMEAKVTVQRTVSINVVGSPSEGLAAMTPVMVPTDVMITGPESKINKIKSVRIDVDIANMNSEVRKTVPVRLLDEEGKDVQEVRAEPNNVEVYIPIENTKKVNVQLDMIGQPAEGYMIKDISVLPDEILITGKDQIIDGISLLKTARIDITGATTDLDKEVSIIMPAGAELVNRNQKVRVYINIEKIVTSEVYVGVVEHINLPDGLVLESLQTGFRAGVKGAESLIKNVQNNTKFYVDLKHAQEGINALDILVDKPEGIEVLYITPQKAEAVLKKAAGAVESADTNEVNN